MKRRAFGALALASLTLFPISTWAQEKGKVHVVKMWTDGSLKYYIPDYLKVEVGDTVRFVNKSGNHNTESISGMIPKDAPAWNSKLNQTFDLKIQHEGVYGYKCTPHYTKGMVGLIVAGDPGVNLAEAQAVKTPRKAKEMFDMLFAQIGK